MKHRHEDDATWNCCGCGSEFQHTPSLDCGGCGDLVCAECAYKCSDCGAPICIGCTYEHEGKDFCPEHQRTAAPAVETIQEAA